MHRQNVFAHASWGCICSWVRLPGQASGRKRAQLWRRLPSEDLQFSEVNNIHAADVPGLRPDALLVGELCKGCAQQLSWPAPSKWFSR